MKIDIPFVAGVHQEKSTRTLLPPELARCENVYFSKEGEIRRRGGFKSAIETAGANSRGPFVVDELGDKKIALVKESSTSPHTSLYSGSSDILTDISEARYPVFSGGDYATLPHSSFGSVVSRTFARPQADQCDVEAGTTTKCYAWITASGGRFVIVNDDEVVLAYGEISASNSDDIRVVYLASSATYYLFICSTSLMVAYTVPESSSGNTTATFDNSQAVSAYTFDAVASDDDVYIVYKSGASQVTWGIWGGTTRNQAVTAGDQHYIRARYRNGSVYWMHQGAATATLYRGVQSTGTVTSQAIASGLAVVGSGGDFVLTSDTQGFALVHDDHASIADRHQIEVYYFTIGSTSAQRSEQQLVTLASRIGVWNDYFVVWVKEESDITATSSLVLCSLGTTSTLSSGNFAEFLPLAVAAQGRAEELDGYTLPSIDVGGDAISILYPSAYNLNDSGNTRAELFKASALSKYASANLGGSILLSGAITRSTDGEQLSRIDLTPTQAITELVGSGSLTGTYSIRATIEWYDAAGRRYQSAPSTAVSVNPSSENIEITIHKRWAHAVGERAVVWMTEDGGTTYYRAGESLITQWSTTITIDSDTGLGANEILYTSASEPDRYPPPALEIVAAAKRRFWGSNGSRLYYSHQLAGDAPQFCAQVFYLDFPESITAIGEIDETPVVFTEKRTFMVRGEGPNRIGQGDWVVDEISSDVGCIEPRSVVQFRGGLMWLSRRGIEYMPRGGGLPSNIGEPIEQTLSDYPYIKSASPVASRGWVVFVLSDEEYDRGNTRLAVYDYTINQWVIWHALNYVIESNSSIQSVSTWNGNLIVGYDGVSSTIGTLAEGAAIYTYSEADGDFTDATVSYQSLVRTGEIRPSGLNRRARWSTVTALGSTGTGTTDYPVQVRVYFDGDYTLSASNSSSWFGTDADDLYNDTTAGTPFQRQYTPGRSQADSVAVELAWFASSADGFEGPRLNGFSVEFMPEDEKTRLGSGSKR